MIFLFDVQLRNKYDDDDIAGLSCSIHDTATEARVYEHAAQRIACLVT